MSQYRTHYQADDIMPLWLKRCVAYAAILCILITLFY